MDDWDFNWQDEYRYATPIALPAGTTLHMEFTYDNSAENPRNPHTPPRRVVYGPHSTDEMGDLWVFVVPRDVRDKPQLAQDYGRKNMLVHLAGFRQKARLDPQNAKAHYSVAAALANLGRLEDALPHVRHALKLDPQMALAHLGLGNVLMRQGDLNGALASYRETVRLDPVHVEAHYKLGRVCDARRNFKAAVRHYRKAIQLDPHRAYLANDLGRALQGQGRIDEAVRHYIEALRLKPDFAEAHNNLGIARQGQGRIDEALAHYAEALRLKPDFANAHHNMGLALQAQGRIDEALARYAEAVHLKPHFAKAHKKLAEVLIQRARFGEAAVHNAESLRLAPDNVTYLHDNAWFLATCPDASHRDGRRAVELAERAARRTFFNDAALLDTLAAAYAEAGRFEEAIATAQKAVRLAPTGKPDALADEIDSRLKLFQNRQPYREP